MSSRFVSVVAVVGLTLVAPACSGSNPILTAPTSPVTPSCQTNNTALVSFENRSPSTMMDILWDGAKIATLGGGTVSPQMTTAAGVPHTLRFQITNTAQLACSQDTPTLAQCSSTKAFCPS